MLTGALIASAAAVGGVVAPASAASGDVANATLDWGVKQSFRTYITSPIAHGSATLGAGATLNGDGTYRWPAGAGSVDDAVPTADVKFGGSVHFSGHNGELDIVLENPRVVVSGGTGTLYLDVTSKGYQGQPGVDADNVPFASLQTGAPTVANNVATWTNAPAALTAEGSNAFQGFYPPGEAIDPVTFALPYAVTAPVATETATSLAAAPTGGAQEGAAVTFTATVTPSAAGTVQFANHGTPLGSPVTVQNGTAAFSSSDLPVGQLSVTATFTPADPAAFLGSASGPLAYTVTAIPGPDAAETTTTLAAPAARTLAGEAVELTATVANAEVADAVPTGTVEFFRVAAGSADRVSVGSAALELGTAKVAPTNIPAGGHTFVAVYTPNSASFLGSESAATANHGVVDTALPLVCNPNAGGVTAETTASATWDWSGYSSGWTKVAGGDVTVDGQTFRLTGGVVKATDVCAQISFSGTLRTEAYAGFFPPNGQWVELVDPTLTMSADGSGAWTAGVRTGVGAYDAAAAAPRLTVATFSGEETGGPGSDGARTLHLDYEGTTAPGTWSVANGVAWANAWPNEFILAVPSAVQAFYYQTDNKGANLTKPPAPIGVEFEWPAVTSITASVSPTVRTELGEQVTFAATVSPSNVPGTVRFLDTPATGDERVLASVEVVDGTAEFVTDELTAGGHALRAQFVPSNGFEGSMHDIASNYGIVDTSTPALCETPARAETLTGVTAEWDWSGYSNDWTKVAGGSVAVDGETFVLSNGVASVSDECTTVAFTGTLRTQAYESNSPPNGFWVEIVNPVLVIDGEGDGSWIGGVRSGAGAYSAGETTQVTVATFSGADGVDFSGDSLSADVVFDYADTTAPGTWSIGQGLPRTSAWVNEFILAVPDRVKAFYYESGAGRDAEKPASPLSLSWKAAAPAVTVAGPAGPVTPGSTLTFSGAGYRLGEQVTATVFSEPLVIGTQTVDASGTVAFSWTVPADFPAGEHRVELAGTRSGTAAAAFTISASAIAPAPAAQVEERCVARAVNGATLEWGVKASFRSYVTGPIAGGSISTSGATATGDTFRWTGGSGAYNTDADRGRVGYSGSVHFTGHGGQLDLTIANPRVQVNGGSASLIADLSSKGLNGAAGVNASGVVIATLGLPEASVAGDRISWNGATATLTAAGAEAFGGFYQAGQALDPVSFAFPLGAEVPCDTTTDGKLASTGADLTAGWIALTLLVLGAGAVFITRRRRANV